MSEPKPLASLSANLLARKGTARPAMRRAFIPGHAPALSVESQDDLGWNDMGADAPAAPHPAPPLLMATGEAAATAPQTPPAIVEQRKALAARFAAVETASPQGQDQPATPEKAEVRSGKAAFTLRLDPARHLRLRLACAVMNKSAQRIVSDALDAFLDSQPDLEKLARQVPRKGNRTKD